MLLALFFWAVVPMMLVHFTQWMDPWTANGTRYFFAASFWLPFVVRALRCMTPAARRTAWRAAVIPAAAHGTAQVFFGIAPYFNNATLLNFGCRLSIPFATIFGFWLLKSERALARSPLFWAGLLCALGGFLLMFAQGLGESRASLLGMLMLLGFSVTWGLYVVFVRRNLTAYPAHLAYGMVSVLTGIPLVGLMFAFGQWAELGHLTLPQWGWLVLSSLLGLTLGHVLYYRAIRVMGHRLGRLYAADPLPDRRAGPFPDGRPTHPHPMAGRRGVDSRMRPAVARTLPARPAHNRPRRKLIKASAR